MLKASEATQQRRLLIEHGSARKESVTGGRPMRVCPPASLLESDMVQWVWRTILGKMSAPTTKLPHVCKQGGSTNFKNMLKKLCSHLVGVAFKQQTECLFLVGYPKEALGMVVECIRKVRKLTWCRMFNFSGTDWMV